MPGLKTGDIVVRKSHNGDIYFKVIDIVNMNGAEINVLLKGIDHRLIADAPISDLVRLELGETDENNLIYSKKAEKSIKKALAERRELLPRTGKQYRADEVFGKAGKVLHIDADEEYMNVCLKTYQQLKIEVVTKLVDEPEQPVVITDLLKEVKPDILVLTGHDGLLKGENNFTDIGSYRSSRFFIEAVKAARSFESSLDDLVIFAGACQSFYEAIIEAGANFASSPHRVLIHALDPVFVCEKVAFSNINKVLSIQETISNTITGIKGIGGLETRGKYRQGFPKSPYS